MSGVVWSKFYWSDWLSDPALRVCSPPARALWIDMLCIAAAHDPIGYVAVAGRALNETSIARMTGDVESEVRALLGELDRNGVFSRDRHGRIYSRRMVRDAKRAAIAKKNGKLGGNPTLGKDEGNPAGDNPQLKSTHKTQEPTAIYPVEEEVSDANASSVVSDEPKATLPDEPRTAFEAWNALAERLGLPRARKLDPSRRQAIRCRLADGGLPVWREALAAIERSSLCRGENDRGWRADLDFVCQAKSWRKLLEGSYADSSEPVVSFRPPKAEIDEDFAARQLARLQALQ